MTDVIVKATKVKRRIKFALFIGKRLTKAPVDNLAVVSDLFPIKQDLNWKTEFEFLNVAGLILGDNNQKELYSAKIYFFDAMGIFLGLRTIQMENIGRKTLKLSELLIGDLVSAKTFAVFHPNVANKFDMAGSYLAERGYGGYEYKNLGVKGYVHGNLDAVALTKDKVKPLGNYGFISRFYTVQHSLIGPSTYEFVFTNPTARKIKITPSISHSPNIWSKAESFHISSLGTYTYTVDVKAAERAYVRFKSRLYLARPVVFRVFNNSMDVFHG
jgi:hypothetical protein